MTAVRNGMFFTTANEHQQAQSASHPVLPDALTGNDDTHCEKEGTQEETSE